MGSDANQTQYLSQLSRGKPVGFKLCLGVPHEFLAVCKALLETGILPYFIIVDGAEGGTGAAPLEFSNSVGTPLAEGLVFVHNALVGCGLRDKVRVACAGKVTSAYHLVRNVAIGADWCNLARCFMMTVGCIQAHKCHTNECPVGVATQDPGLFRALNVGDKSERVDFFHFNTMESLSESVAAMGSDSPAELDPWNVYKRFTPVEIATYDRAFRYPREGELLKGGCDQPKFERWWDRASADSFAWPRHASVSWAQMQRCHC